MKRLKKVLLVCLFSFLFLGFANVKAYTKEDFPKFPSVVGSNNYAIVYAYYGENSSSNKVTLVYCKDNALLATTHSYGSSSTAGKVFKCSSGYVYVRDLVKGSAFFNSFNAQSLFNEEFNFLDGTYYWNGNEYSSQNNYNAFAIFNPNESRLNIVSDLNNVGVIYTNTDIYYSDVSHIILSKDVFGPVLTDLGTFNNSNVLTYKIKDTEPGKGKELKLKFTFLNQLDVSANDIQIYKYGSQVYTEYSGITCANEDTNSVCELNFEYDVYDSISDKIMFDFKFSQPYNVKVEDNSGTNGIYSNYKDVEFEYKLLDFKEMSGAVFYLRNYDNFNYMKDYLSNVEYNFRISNCIDYAHFTGPTIYGNDIKYKNTYLIEDSNNVFKYNFDNFLTLNNIGIEFIDFAFDSNLLEEDKYSAFVLENLNYLGSNDTDNLDLYVYYNSSLFNYNELNYSTIVNSGNTDSYVSTGGDYNFTINGSQQTITGGVNSGHITEFDEEIKVQYKVGLEYFKDKIIDMFEFVSEFYNTMPEKFRIAFSLIFVLLIGIALFRLLL